jgi:hypothetical protein
MFIVVGLGFALGALHYNFGTSASPGPAYFPFGLGMALAVLGAVILFRSLAVRTEDGEPIGELRLKPLAIITGAIVLNGLTLPWLGLFISLPLLVLTSALAGEEFHFGEVIFNAAILTAGSWAVFNKALNLPIPLLPAFLA